MDITCRVNLCKRISGLVYVTFKKINMDLNDIECIVILVQLKNGNAHQVLTTKENKEIALNIIAASDGKLCLDEELEPITFKTKK